MKLFISYSSTRADLCERLRLALEAEGHEVFADRADLRAGEGYNATLREAIQDADRFIFLISPESVAPGSYTLAELSIAQERWRAPAGHVLPVVIAPTDRASIPPYLLAVTLLQPKGEPVAEIVAAVARMAPKRPRLMVAAGCAVIALALIGGGWWWQQRNAQARAESARQELASKARQQAEQELDRQLNAATELCATGNRAVAWGQLERLAASQPASAKALVAREDCAMRWLRNASVTEGKETFTQLADRLQPALANALASATGQRAADLRAHLAWADFLRGRDGTRAAPQVPQYEQAVKDDPNNVYANAMWAHRLMWASTDRADEAASQFATALRDGRDRAFVRELQFAAFLGREDTEARAFAVANEMRVGGEVLDADAKRRIWRDRLMSALRYPDRRAKTLAVLPPADWLATFRWLVPEKPSDAEAPEVRFGLALMKANAGDVAGARADLEALRADPGLRFNMYAGEAERVLETLARGR